jgi:glucose dehydrogenase
MEIRLGPTGRETTERYRLAGAPVLFAHDGLPCNRPRWGRLVAVEVDKGEIAWSVSTSTGPNDFGNSTYAPSLATAGGLVFHGGTYFPFCGFTTLRQVSASVSSSSLRACMAERLRSWPLALR